MAEAYNIPQTNIEIHNITTFNASSGDEGAQNMANDVKDQTLANVITIEIEKYILPVICILGLIGNTLSTITFSRKQLRNSPCSLYLAIRGISDNGFLLGLFLVWTSSTFDLKLSHVKGVCQVTIFTTYVCGCVSVWLCVFITFENFLLIQSPFSAKRICCKLVTRICVAVLILAAFGIYNTSLWIINEDCYHKPGFSAMTQVLVYTDTLLTLVLPIVIIFCLVSVISYKLTKILHIRRRHSSMMEKIAHVRPIKPIIPIAKVTKMLFVVSLVFFLLNVPSHVIRLMLLIGSFTKGHNTASNLQGAIQSVLQLLYYLSFSVNFFVYWIFGSNFRKMFKKTFCTREQPSCDIHTPTEAVNLVRQRRHSINGAIQDIQNEAFLMIPNMDAVKHCHSFS